MRKFKISKINKKRFFKKIIRTMVITRISMEMNSIWKVHTKIIKTPSTTCSTSLKVRAKLIKKKKATNLNTKNCSHPKKTLHLVRRPLKRILGNCLCQMT